MEHAMDEPLSSCDTIAENTNFENDSDFSMKFLEDYDSTWEIINSRITVSRMVTDSVIKGIVNAVIEDSNEKIGFKEGEIANLTKELQFYKSGDSDRGKLIEELSDIRKQIGDLSEFFFKEFGAHIAGSEHLMQNSEECIEEIFSDLMKFNCMKREEIISYFKDEITKMKREHDSLLQGKIEEIFTLKGELLKERGSNPLHSELMRKKVSKVITNLDQILGENENALRITHGPNQERENEQLRTLLLERKNELERMVGNHNEKILALDRENERLRGLLVKGENELERAVQEREEKILALDHENKRLRRLLVDRESELERMVHDYNKKILVERENERMRGLLEESESELERLVHERDEKISALDRENERLRGLIVERENEMEGMVLNSLSVETESVIESSVREKIQITIFEEIFNEIRNNVQDLKRETLSLLSVDSMEKVVRETDNELGLKTEESEKLKKLVNSLSRQVREKEKFTFEFESTMMQLNMRFNMIMHEINLLIKKINVQDSFFLESRRDFDLIFGKLEGVLEKANCYESEIIGLKHKFEKISGDLEKEKAIQSEAKEEFKKWAESIIISVKTLSKSVTNCEWRLINNVECCESRIVLLKNKCEGLIKDAKFMNKSMIWQKQALEMRNRNLRKAEIEVDLLGDEVDSLTFLLEKTYGVLNRYSPVFQHYPGVMEISKMIRNYMDGDKDKQ